MALHALMIGAKSVIFPRVFDAWVIATILGSCCLINSLQCTLLIVKSFSIGKIMTSAPVRCANCCQGTMLAWCSMADMAILSPGLSLEARPFAIKLIDSVAPFVHTISLLFTEK